MKKAGWVIFMILLIIILLVILIWFLFRPVCGNGKLENRETSLTCCLDAGCLGDQKCENNKCLEPQCNQCQYLNNHKCENYSCCVDKDCPVNFECKLHTCQKKPIIANIETNGDIIVLKNKDDVSYTYSDCKIPEKIAISDDKVMKYIYSRLNDSFDYAIIYTNFESCQSEHQVNTKNDIKGIGLNIFDSSKEYGSEGKLKGVIRFGDVEVPNPNPDYLFLHEFGHNWGIFINSDLKNNQNHWDDLASLGECDVMSAYGGLFSLKGDAYFSEQCAGQWGYSKLMLYLMGIGSKEELSQDKYYLLEKVDENDPFKGYKTKSEFTIDNIIFNNGERIPSSDESPKEFNVAFILVTDKNGPSQTDIDTSRQIINNYKEWFSEATNNRASVDFSVL